MDRSCLASRYKRRELVNYFTDVINSCAEGNKIYDTERDPRASEYSRARARASRLNDKWLCTSVIDNY